MIDFFCLQMLTDLYAIHVPEPEPGTAVVPPASAGVAQRAALAWRG
jgi:hypothetical protein